MAIQQRRYIRDAAGRARDAEWTLDLDVLARTQRWAQNRERLGRELIAMREMYPTWTLTLGAGKDPATRAGHADVLIPAAGAWRWASDGLPAKDSSLPELLRKALAALAGGATSGTLLWEGYLPAPLHGLETARKKIEAKYPVEEIGGRPWTSVPIRAFYPDDYPQSEPYVFYDSLWLSNLKLSGAAHIVSDARLCLFYPGQWKRNYTLCDVISQRVLNHVYSVLKMGNGESSDKAFIGRIHDAKWRPSA